MQPQVATWFVCAVLPALNPDIQKNVCTYFALSICTFMLYLLQIILVCPLICLFFCISNNNYVSVSLIFHDNNNFWTVLEASLVCNGPPKQVYQAPV